MTITYTTCPLCGGDALFPFIKCKDFTVSQEIFEIVQCGSCAFKFTQNIPDQNSIGPYYKSEDYVSHTRTKKGLINQLYHTVKGISLERKYKLVRSLTSGNTVIDYGCGTGEFLYECKKKGWNTQGYEPSEEARALANNYGLGVTSPETLINRPDNSTDVITLWHVLEHVHTLKETLLELKRVLKPGGKLIIAVPNCSSNDAGHYKEYWAAYDVPRHLYHFEPATMNKLVTELGMTAKGVQPMKFDSYYVSLLSEKYKNNGKMNLSTLINGFTNGLSSNAKANKQNLAYSSLIYIFEKPLN